MHYISVHSVHFIWCTPHFTCSGGEKKKIIELFKEAQIKIAFWTRSTIQNVVKPHPQIDKYEKSVTK
jgi:hypothetical protein